MDVVVVIDAPEHDLAPGRQRRIRSIVRHLENLGCTTRLVASGTQASLAGRALTSLSLRRTLAGIEGADAVVVAGFSAPHLVLLAQRIARRVPTVLDVCDSWVMQEELRAELGLVARTVPKVGAWLQRRAGRVASVAYISGRDAQADIDAGLCESAVVVPQAVDDALTALPPVAFPLTRLTVAADLVSYQNTALWEVVEAQAADLVAQGLPELEVYGKVPDGYEPPPGVIVRGWAPELASVYEGDTGVIVTNSAGSGVPNKMLEAIAAGRPVVAAQELSYVPHRPSDRIYWWRPDQPLADVVRAMVAGAPVPAGEAADAAWPELSFETLAGVP